MPRVSIITPAKIDNDRSLGWLREMIESVLKQTFSEWELLVVNDHSKVSWRPIANMFDDDRVYGLKSPHESPSVARARNFAVSKSTTKLLLPVDADDKLHHGGLKRFLDAWDQRGHQEGIVYTDVEMFDEDTSRYYKNALV